MGILDTLGLFGIKPVSDSDIYKDEEMEKQAEALDKEKNIIVPKIFSEDDYIYEKNMQCAICGASFKTKKVRASKMKFIGTDSDLRPIHEGIDTVKYDAIVCTSCGYASLERMYDHITNMQIKEVREKISATFSGMPYHEGAYTYNEAIERYKLTLYNCIVRKLKTSEKAYICLKLAWLYRGKAQNTPKNDPNYEIIKADCEVNERELIKNAYEGFLYAAAKETGTICGMDRFTFSYLMGELGRKNQDYDRAVKFLNEIISSRSVASKVKEKATDLYHQIKKEKQALENES